MDDYDKTVIWQSTDGNVRFRLAAVDGFQLSPRYTVGINRAIRTDHPRRLVVRCYGAEYQIPEHDIDSLLVILRACPALTR